MEIVTDFIFLGSKITAEGNSSHEIKTFVPWKKSYNQLDSILESSDLTFTNKGSSSQSYGFPSSHV